MHFLQPCRRVHPPPAAPHHPRREPCARLSTIRPQSNSSWRSTLSAQLESRSLASRKPVLAYVLGSLSQTVVSSPLSWWSSSCFTSSAPDLYLSIVFAPELFLSFHPSCLPRSVVSSVPSNYSTYFQCQLSKQRGLVAFLRFAY